jgi:hypothetical protein
MQPISKLRDASCDFVEVHRLLAPIALDDIHRRDVCYAVSSLVESGDWWLMSLCRARVKRIRVHKNVAPWSFIQAACLDGGDCWPVLAATENRPQHE